jgi:hypothetical protein
MSGESDVIILCEGYDDRSFWKGLLLRAGCVEERRPREPRYQAKPGIYIFRSPDERVVYVVPAQSVVLDLARDELRSRVEKPFARLVLNLDIDDRTIHAARQSVTTIVREADAAATESGNEFLLDGGSVRVSFVPWVVGVAAGLDGVPAQQALERLACAAISRVYPARARALADWLRARPDPAGKEHKAHAWSFYAGWYTHHGTGFFYEALWKDAAVARELEALLRDAGAWGTIEAVAGAD